MLFVAGLFELIPSDYSTTEFEVGLSEFELLATRPRKRTRLLATKSGA